MGYISNVDNQLPTTKEVNDALEALKGDTIDNRITISGRTGTDEIIYDTPIIFNHTPWGKTVKVPAKEWKSGGVIERGYVYSSFFITTAVLSDGMVNGFGLVYNGDERYICEIVSGVIYKTQQLN